MTMGYQNCIFDLYGTLVDIRTDERSPRLWVRMTEIYRRNGAAYQPGELRDAYFRLVHELEGDLSPQQDAHEVHPEIQIEQVFRQLYEEKGTAAGIELLTRTGRMFRKYSTEYLRLYDGAAELLWALRAKGRGVWLLSNAQSLFTRWELEQLGLSGLFNGIYLSSDYGCKKPDPRFFCALLDGEGIDPRSAVMIGNDGTCDMEGARAVGISTIYIRSNLSPNEPPPQADHLLEQMDLKRALNILAQEEPSRIDPPEF